MKKILIIAILAVSMFMCFSCKDKTQTPCKCYECDYVTAEGVSAKTYLWLNEFCLDEQKAIWKKAGYTDIECKQSSDYKTIEDCVAQNETYPKK